MKVYFDTNVLIAAMLENHVHHDAAFEVLLRAHKREIQCCISGHSLAEFYAVLTRAPLIPPVSPYQALQMLESNVLPQFEVTSLSEGEYHQAIRDSVRAGWSGGRIYDVLHLVAARKAHCDRLYTYNVRHFREIGSDFGEKIRTP